MEKKDLFKRKIEVFKENWQRERGVPPTEKLVWYYEKGLEKQSGLEDGQPMIVAERFFIGVTKISGQNFPNSEDIDECLIAFTRGCVTELH